MQMKDPSRTQPVKARKLNAGNNVAGKIKTRCDISGQMLHLGLNLDKSPVSIPIFLSRADGL